MTRTASVAAGVLAACTLTSQAQEPGSPAPRPDSVANAREVAAAIDVQVDTADGRRAAELVSEPLLRYGDLARDNDDGTVWAWGRTGRPAAVMELYFNTTSGSRILVVHTLADRPLEAVGGDGFRWTPGASPLELKAVPRAEPPADREPRRLTQMKQIARRLAAHEFWDPKYSRYELRLLAQPVHRYRDPDAGLVDGALFIFAHGTNPEVVLLVEARASDDAAPAWRYGFVRLGHAEMHVSLDGTEVWTVPRVDRMPATDPYWLFYKAPAAVEVR